MKFVPRAPKQQVAHIDRRGALLREAVHRIVEQCKIEGLTVPFQWVLSDAVFCGNAMLSINGTTPYNAVYGRCPPLLPEMEMPIDDAKPGTARHVRRMREISIQAMIEGTPKNRIERAMNTKTLTAGESHDYNIGELVDFYRPQSTKDVSGWKGAGEAH